ncbi:GGDEF domain-containing protein [Novispirillum sp. DQ9]|uniref:GGDEF domain-containing protein n=1 Tax=Novispirillum sp. DQ9 TaxID=3398612 RepID=UPI003C7EC0A1
MSRPPGDGGLEELPDSLFRALFDDHAAILLVADATSLEVVAANRAARAFYGRALAGLPLPALSDGPAEAVRRTLAEARTGRPGPVVARHRVAGGALRDVEILVGTLDHGGRPLLALDVHDVSDRVRLEQDLRHLAAHDPLTGAFNRRAFVDAALREQARASRHGHPLSVLLLDLDRFKAVNDTHGHGAGDGVLVHFVQLMNQMLRASDVLGRTGGEEFAVLLPHTDRANALAIAERLRGAVEATPAPHAPHPIAVTVSIGVSQVAPGEDGIDAALGRADRALYRAKDLGRNRVAAE